MESQPDEPLNPYASPKSDLISGSGQWPEAPQALAQGEVLRLEGTISPKDLFHANSLTSRPGPSDVFGCIILLFFMLLPWGVLLSMGIGPIGGLLTALFGLGLSVFAGCKALGKLRQINRYWRHQRGVCQPQRVEVSDAEIRQQTETGWSVYRWSAFSRYTGSRRVVVLHFDPPGAFLYEPPQAFLLLPRTFFASQADWDRFVRLVHEKLSAKYHEERAR